MGGTHPTKMFSCCIDLIVILFFRYDSSSGLFTVPSGGDGFYYFSVFLNVDGDEYGYFDVEINGQLMCTVCGDLTISPDTDYEATSCSGIVYAVEGKHNKKLIVYLFRIIVNTLFTSVVLHNKFISSCR